MTKTIKERLEYLRGEIEKECISYEEIAELQSLAEHIEPGDTVLLEWAGFPETPEEQLIIFEYQNDDGQETEWFWTKKIKRAEIEKECYDWIADANEFTDEETRKMYTVNDFWIVEDAVKRVLD